MGQRINSIAGLIVPTGTNHNEIPQKYVKHETQQQTQFHEKYFSTEHGKIIESLTKSDRIFTNHDMHAKMLGSILVRMGVLFPRLSEMITEYLPLYQWNNEGQPDTVGDGIDLSYNNSVASNKNLKFGATLGSALDENVDHLIHLKLVHGVEFGAGVCTAENLKLGWKRDFMCEPGGWGYYNYQSKTEGTKIKYPPGFYAEKHAMSQAVATQNIVRMGDILTLLLVREFGETEVDEHKNSKDQQETITERKGEMTWALKFYKNGEYFGHMFNNIKGPLFLSLNYYYLETTVQVLRDRKSVV